MSKEYTFEKVTFIPSPLNNGQFIPKIAISTAQGATSSSPTKATSNNNDNANDTNNNKDGKKTIRSFRPEDMTRVLDFEKLPTPPPPDAILGHLEFELDDKDVVKDNTPPQFPKRYFCLRGSYIFYFNVEQNPALSAPHASSSPYATPPMGVIPLERTHVESPPGGRRCFREHAQTAAKNGYEIMIRHVPRQHAISSSGSVVSGATDLASVLGAASASGMGNNSTLMKRRAPAYLVFDSLGQKAQWQKAIELRSNFYKKDTKLRPSTIMTPGGGMNSPPAGSRPKLGMGFHDIMNESSNTLMDEREKRDAGAFSSSSRLTSTSSPERGKGVGVGGTIAVLAGVMDVEEQKAVQEALDHFGDATQVLDEEAYVNRFLQMHDENELKTFFYKLDKWQSSIKKGLRGAVLEQYEFFVEASREMTIMGREVAVLKDLVAKQVDTIESMKAIDFDLVLNDTLGEKADGNGNFSYEDIDADTYSSDEDNVDVDVLNKSLGDSASVESGESGPSWGVSKKKTGTLGSDGTSTRKSSKAASRAESKKELGTEGSDKMSFDDIELEISSFIKECRYTAATDLLLKTKADITEILNQHDRLTEKKLTRKQFTKMQRTLRAIEALTEKMCNRLCEGLRQKNEALRQIAKQERADPMSAMCPIVSPIAINDDAISLQLLVRLSRPGDAATAYCARRSLLLNECLHERPICSMMLSNSMDVAIYASQLSYSFFTSLASSVEGFLDLFADNSSAKDDLSHSSSIITGGTKTIPASALAAVTLWCDSELSKFATVFGNKVLGTLSLSAREVSTGNKISDKISKLEFSTDINHMKNQLRLAEERGEYATAGKLRKKISIQQNDEKEGKLPLNLQTSKSTEDKDRQTAIEIASKCIDECFKVATEYLNSIGLPLTPRLAEYLRPRLKGCDIDVATELEVKWDHLLFDWKTPAGNSSDPPSPRRGEIGSPMSAASKDDTVSL